MTTEPKPDIVVGLKPDQWPPITDEKLEDLDSWYRKFTSNSFEMKFCDADYWALRNRLKLAEAVCVALNTSRALGLELSGGEVYALEAWRAAKGGD